MDSQFRSYNRETNSAPFCVMQQTKTQIINPFLISMIFQRVEVSATLDSHFEGVSLLYLFLEIQLHISISQYGTGREAPLLQAYTQYMYFVCFLYILFTSIKKPNDNNPYKICPRSFQLNPNTLPQIIKISIRLMIDYIANFFYYNNYF